MLNKFMLNGTNDFYFADKAAKVPQNVEIFFTGLCEKAELNGSTANWTPLGCRKACSVLPHNITASNSRNR